MPIDCTKVDRRDSTARADAAKAAKAKRPADVCYLADGRGRYLTTGHLHLDTSADTYAYGRCPSCAIAVLTADEIALPHTDHRKGSECEGSGRFAAPLDGDAPRFVHAATSAWQPAQTDYGKPKPYRVTIAPAAALDGPCACGKGHSRPNDRRECAGLRRWDSVTLADDSKQAWRDYVDDIAGMTRGSLEKPPASGLRPTA